MNLTNDIREGIKRRLLAHRFDADLIAATAKIAKASLVVYNAIYSKAERDLMNAMPAGFMHHRTAIYIEVTRGDNYDNYTRLDTQLQFALPVAAKHAQGNHVEGMNDHPAVIALNQAYVDQKVLLKQKEKVEQEIHATLRQATTVARLLDLWPEVSPFLPPPAPKKALAVLPTGLNDALKLPVKKAKAALRDRRNHQVLAA